MKELVLLTDAPPMLLKPLSENPGGDVRPPMFSLLVAPGTAPVKVGENDVNGSIIFIFRRVLVIPMNGGGEVVNFYSLKEYYRQHTFQSQKYTKRKRKNGVTTQFSRSSIKFDGDDFLYFENYYFLIFVMLYDRFPYTTKLN